MFPTIEKKETGKRLKKLMIERGYTAKNIQEYLFLGSVQSVYHWFNGASLPTVDNLYALSELFGVPIDDLICGNRMNLPMDLLPEQYKRIHWYAEKIKELQAA